MKGRGFQSIPNAGFGKNEGTGGKDQGGTGGKPRHDSVNGSDSRIRRRPGLE